MAEQLWKFLQREVANARRCYGEPRFLSNTLGDQMTLSEAIFDAGHLHRGRCGDQAMGRARLR